MSNREKSAFLFKKAQASLPGGVDSPVRAFGSVGGTPVFFRKGMGSRMQDVDGNWYIDYVLSWGPLILGHAHDAVRKKIAEAAVAGTSFGAPCEAEIELAELIKSALPSIELIRFVNSGTEATMSALRVARGFTKRHKIVKFNGCYHGHSDQLLVKAGSGAMTLGQPDSAGVTPGAVADTIVLEFNDLAGVKDLFRQQGKEIAAVIVEPVAGNMGVVPPAPGFLETLRSECTAHGTILIFDEVMTGYRVAYGGAQLEYDVIPDMTTLAKVIGGGMPVGAYGGRREIMETVAPLGPVYQAGTLAGNPLAMAAGVATLKELGPGSYPFMERQAQIIGDEMRKSAEKLGVSLYVAQAGTMFTAFFTDQKVTNYATAKTADTKKFAAFFHALLDTGIYIAPSQFETGFMSTAHSTTDIEITCRATYEALKVAREA